MDKSYAKIEYEKIIHEQNKKVIAAMEDAKKNGAWKPGLDVNEEIFTTIKEETKQQIDFLKSMIDEIEGEK